MEAGDELTAEYDKEGSLIGGTLKYLADAGTGGDECGNTFNLNANPSVGIGTWTLRSGNGNVTFNDPNDPNAIATVDTYGSYDFQWTEQNGICEDQNI